MSSRAAVVDTGMSASFIVSAVIHVAVFLLFVWWGKLFPPKVSIQETYYVDVVSLPSIDPQAGNAPQKVGEAGQTALAPPPAPPQMTIPTKKTVPKAAAKPLKQLPQHESADTESAFAERMARLEKNTEARHEEAVLEKLRRKVKTTGTLKSGVPGAGGAEAASRYADYIKSRLEDALKVTSSYTTRNPEVAVRLTIAADGRLLRMKIERSSGDATFELAVRRAIDLASEKFIANPNRAVFENGFVFKPKGISNNSLR